jgi:glyoxylase-like metal-dependent hydrolase (beta-lactamase superfamily II)/ferredoxin
VATPARRLPTNADGDVYVDDSCIDCGACRWIAPATFDSAGDYSRVHTQPSSGAETKRALMALVACPTASIGTESKQPVRDAARAYPDPITAGVHHLGFHAESSFGAASYLVERDRGNVMVDVPRFNRGLADRIEGLGGVKTIFLTHRDDVADHEQWAERFGAERVLHADDATRATRGVERWIEGIEEQPLDDGLLVIPTPGHTRGSMCLLHEDVLFTGDHLAYRIAEDRVVAFRGACWYDWPTQIASMRRVARHSFEWILPGHGAPCHFERGRMRQRLEACIAWMDDVC